MYSDLLPKMRTQLPGPRSRALSRRMRKVECPQITYVGGPFPVFWARASGMHVWDVDGNRFLDFSAAFGVQNVGHTHPRVIGAMGSQAKRLIHGMGDVHPSALKIKLGEALKRITPGALSHSIFSSSGAEAVESALKTAHMYTGKPGVVAFEGAYHGLTYGALHVTHRADFRFPFSKQLAPFSFHVPFPSSSIEMERAWSRLNQLVAQKKHAIGAVIIEPVQGRGGVRLPYPGFLKALRRWCTKKGIILIFDEIMTGFGRTGRWFACEHEHVTPDLLVLGKGMTGGFPISSVIGSKKIMAAWGVSAGESIHTSTFLGSPLGSASALATISIIKEEKLIPRARLMGNYFLRALRKLQKEHPIICDVRGRGLMVGLELRPDRTHRRSARTVASRLVSELLCDGIIVLSSGSGHNVISFTPPLCVKKQQMDFMIDCLYKRLSVLSER